MPRFQMEIRDPDTRETVHVCTHPVFGWNWYDAILRFTDKQHGYPFEPGGWKLLARELDQYGNPIYRKAPPGAVESRR